MAYDRELNLVYVGTGNGAKYNARRRSPRGGDNLYLASIIALDAATGEMKWFFQQVPAESWDYTATQKFILADLAIDGRTRKVIMQAPKNGFFYVLDRETGELISARNHTYVNWTKGLDPDRAARTESRRRSTAPRDSCTRPWPARIPGRRWRSTRRRARLHSDDRRGLRVYRPGESSAQRCRRLLGHLRHPGRGLRPHSIEVIIRRTASLRGARAHRGRSEPSQLCNLRARLIRFGSARSGNTRGRDSGSRAVS